jgi:AP endonuclease-2
MNTCWDTKRNTRPANNGSRIDYVLCSDGIRSWFKFANIQEGLMGSDHCPVFATFSDKVTVGGGERALMEMVNPPDMFQGERRLRDWSTKDLLPLSAKLIPEFDRRRSIRDMFTKKATPAVPPPESTKTDTPAESSMNENSSTQASTSKLDEISWSQASTTSTSRLSETVSPAKPSTSQLNTKRTVPAADTTSRSFKRSKSSTSASGNKSKAATGQRTLQGFFKPKAPTAQDGKLEVTAASSTPSLTKKPTATAKVSASPQQLSNTPLATLPEGSQPTLSLRGNDPDTSDRVFDPIEAKESWSKLLGKRVAPRCEHSEPCISLTTRKPGVNCGTLYGGG